MDQNNTFEQNVYGNPDSLPGFDPQSQQSQQPPQFMPQYAPQSPYAQQEPYPGANAHKIEAGADSAFGKSLASVIMAWFPICSFIAIFLAAAGLRCSSATSDLAARLGMSAGGKNVAARIMGTIGLISSIIMSVFWIFYILLIFAMLNLTMSM